MRLRTTGKVTDRLWFLGREESGVYILEGDSCSMMISAGMSYLIPDVLRQIREFGIDERRIRKLLILHAHFDHVGIVPFFKRRIPELEVLGSARAWEILASPRNIETINAFSRAVAAKMGKEEALAGCDCAWRDDVRGLPVREGDVVDLGGVALRILETPGHSSCAIAAYEPERRMLFPSDAAGIPYGDTIITSGNSNFTQYQRSLEKMSALPVSWMCADHYGYVTGAEAAGFIGASIETARAMRAFMEDAYRRNGSVDGAVDEMVRVLYEAKPDYFLAPEIMRGVYHQMVRHVAAALDSPV
ncbi:MAG: Metallo-beta-lactamase L1 precursor [Syntrophaceae bacterium PtaU1.Bin231]|nr:MAG: Metallo-beta-lactamase L1 precursor [Syntrophaceae bacterium PtaU1.Bin231]HOG15898.1 MBL fold metallo-hydrolase [Syntrophales bacterium]